MRIASIIFYIAKPLRTCTPSVTNYGGDKMIRNAALFLLFFVASPCVACDWQNVMFNVITFMDTRGEPHELQKVEPFLFYGDLVVETIAVVETGGVHTIGVINADDKTMHQINSKYWSLAKISLLTGVEITNDNIEANSGIVAAHIWLYNMLLYVQKKEIKNLCEAVATYHNPHEIKPYYEKRVVNIIKMCKTMGQRGLDE